MKRNTLTQVGGNLSNVAFAESGHLNDHPHTHGGRKPFTCDTCGLCFGQNGHLTSHIRIHTGEKPFKCDLCGLCFSQSGNKFDVSSAHPFWGEAIQM